MTGRDDWNQPIVNERSRGGNDTYVDRAIIDLGGFPKAQYDHDMWWKVNFDPNTGKVTIYLVKQYSNGGRISLDTSKGYRVYPNGNDYINTGEMVPIPSS